MALYSFDAIEMTTDDGYGLPTTFTDTSIGFSSGIFRARTGRFTISTATGDSSVTTWYTGVLTDESISCSRSADLSIGGTLADASGLEFSVINVDAFWKTLEDAEIDLNRCRVSYYYATSANGTDWTFYKRWTGVVDAQPYNELTLKIQCVDNRKDVLSSIPKSGVEKNRFPKAPSDSLDKIIPLVYGRVAKSPTINVNEAGDKAYLCVINGHYYTVAGCTSYGQSALGTTGITVISTTDRFITLYTPGTYFNVNDPQIVGKYLNIVQGGVEQSRIIKANEPTNSSNILKVYFSDALDTTNAFVAWSLGSTSKDTWYAEIGDYKAILITSGDVVYEQIKNQNGLVSLYQYGEDTKRYLDVSSIQSNSSTTEIETTGLPGIKATSVSNLQSGSIDTYRPIVPDSVVLVSLTSMTTSEATVGQAMPAVIDIDRDTNVTFVEGATTSLFGFTVDIYLNDFDKLSEFDELYVLPDFTESTNTNIPTRQVALTLSVYDIYGRAVSTEITSELILDDTLSTGSTRDEFFLPNVYYGDRTDSENGFYEKKSGFDISEIVKNVKHSLTYNRIRVQFVFYTSTIASAYTFNLCQLGLVAKSTVRYTTEPIYHDVVGSVFGSEWNGRKTATDPCLLLGDVMEKLIRDHDYGYKPWEASKAYSLGEIVKTGDDNKHYYLCTVAGTSGASEPTWSTTAYASITDNSITWKEIGTFAIDEDAFDLLNNSTRSSSFVGRALTEKTDTENIIRELASQFMLGVRTDADGAISPIAFLDQAVSLADFDETNSWDVSDVSYTQSLKVANEFEIKYAYDYASKTFNKQIIITHVDRPSFPAINEISSTAATLGTFTIFKIPVLTGSSFEVDTDVAHGLESGALVALVGNSDGFDFNPTPIAVVSTTSFRVNGGSTAAGSSSSGSLYSVTSDGMKWKEYVVGIQSYATAKTLWERCSQSYQKIKVIQKYPSSLSECKWIIDANATDANGNILWPGLDSENINPAYRLILDLTRWAAWQKKVISFSVDKTSTNLALNVFDYVTFADDKNTQGESMDAWISAIHDMPKSGNSKEYLRITVICYPNFAEGPAVRVIDSPGASNRIIDTPDYTDRLLDTPQ